MAYGCFDYDIWMWWIYFIWIFRFFAFSFWKNGEFALFSRRRRRILHILMHIWQNGHLQHVTRVCRIHFTCNFYDSALGCWKNAEKRRIWPIFKVEATNAPGFGANGCPEYGTWMSWVHFIWKLYDSACSCWKNASKRWIQPNFEAEAANASYFNADMPRWVSKIWFFNVLSPFLGIWRSFCRRYLR